MLSTIPNTICWPPGWVRNGRKPGPEVKSGAEPQLPLSPVTNTEFHSNGTANTLRYLRYTLDLSGHKTRGVHQAGQAGSRCCADCCVKMPSRPGAWPQHRFGHGSPEINLTSNIKRYESPCLKIEPATSSKAFAQVAVTSAVSTH